MSIRLKKLQRQTSAQILAQLPMDVEEKRALRKNGLFTEAQLLKYRKWFNAMDTDSSGSVNVDELSSVLLSSGIMKYKYEVENMFRAADCDRSGEISFEEFVSGIGSTIAAGKLQLHRLDALIDETNVLSAETMLSQARREILMEHIIHNTTQRTAEIERATSFVEGDRSTVPRRGARRMQQTICLNDIKGHRNFDNLVAHHQTHRLKSMQTISNLSRVLSAEISRNSLEPLAQNNLLASKTLVPLESILDPSLWDLIDPSLRTLSDQVSSCPLDYSLFSSCPLRMSMKLITPPERYSLSIRHHVFVQQRFNLLLTLYLSLLELK
jgi:hypothetical protein